MARWRAPAAITVMAAVVVVASCAACAGDEAAPPTSTIGSVAVATAVPVPVGSPTPSSGVSPATSDSPSARAPTTTVAATTSTTHPGIAGRVADAVTVREVGRSVEGRPITAVERGDPGGVPVVVLGAIHGDEDDGVAILERLASAPLPPGVDLWLLESMNPDGQAAEQRGNANGVDLNGNFPHDWAPIAQPGDGEYAGTGPASEPETRAVVEFLTELEPA